MHNHSSTTHQKSIVKITKAKDHIGCSEIDKDISLEDLDKSEALLTEPEVIQDNTVDFSTFKNKFMKKVCFLYEKFTHKTPFIEKTYKIL